MDEIIDAEEFLVLLKKADCIRKGFENLISALIEANDIEGMTELASILAEFTERKIAEWEFKYEYV